MEMLLVGPGREKLIVSLPPAQRAETASEVIRWNVPGPSQLHLAWSVPPQQEPQANKQLEPLEPLHLLDPLEQHMVPQREQLAPLEVQERQELPLAMVFLPLDRIWEVVYVRNGGTTVDVIVLVVDLNKV